MEYPRSSGQILLRLCALATSNEKSNPPRFLMPGQNSDTPTARGAPPSPYNATKQAGVRNSAIAHQPWFRTLFFNPPSPSLPAAHLSHSCHQAVLSPLPVHLAAMRRPYPALPWCRLPYPTLGILAKCMVASALSGASMQAVPTHVAVTKRSLLLGPSCWHIGTTKSPCCPDSIVRHFWPIELEQIIIRHR